jgi:hypothetical protein
MVIRLDEYRQLRPATGRPPIPGPTLREHSSGAVTVQPGSRTRAAVAQVCAGAGLVEPEFTLSRDPAGLLAVYARASLA